MRVMLKDSVNAKDRLLDSWLYKGKEYIVLAVEQHSSCVAGYRLSSEDGGQPVVFDAGLFDVCDARLPASWIILGLQGATLELGPEEFARPGFWEHVFDREPSAIEAYRAAKERIFAESG